MSVADSGDYQLESLAETLSNLAKGVSDRHALDLYRQAYEDALRAVAEDMGLTVKYHINFRYGGE